MTPRTHTFWLACGLIASLTIAAHAQTHPDFSGTWKVDKVDVTDSRNSNGDRGRFGGGGGGGGFGRGGGRRGGGGFPGGGQRGGRQGGNRGEGRPEGERQPARLALRQGDVVRIRQTEERVIITTEGPDSAVMMNYTVDGKETKNRLSDDVEVKSKTTWEGVALVTNSSQQVSGGRGSVTIKTREIRSLSEDGETMTVQTTTETGFGKRTAVATLTRSGT